MAAPTLARLIEPAGAAALLASARELSPEASIRLLDGVGRVVAATEGEGSGGDSDAAAQASVEPVAVEPVAVDGETVGTVEVRGVASQAGAALARFVARAVELAAAEAGRRRAVTTASLNDLRELSLLSRLTAMLGDAVDPGAIAGCTLETVSRPLGASVGLVLGTDDRTAVARIGEPGDAEHLGSAAQPLIERLRGADAAVGTCADVEHSADGPVPSILVAFLRTARGDQGSIALGRPVGGAPFSAAARQLLAAAAGQAAVAIERAALQRQVSARQVLDHELAIGRRIQVSLMPRRFPEVPGWEIASAYEAAREVGGDFYDVFPLRDRPGQVALVVADVTGKGIPAAILMADSRALIHAAADYGDDPADTLARVNRIIVAERATGLFVTAALAILDSPTGRMRLASAGHDPVHVLRADGRLEILAPPGRLIGMVDDIRAATTEIELEPGDSWIGHTDGVTEARDPSGAFYGEERFRELLVRLAGQPARAIVAAVVADVASFRGLAEASDDLTLLVVRRSATVDGADPG